MIQTGRMHHDGGKNILRSHHLHPGNDVSLFIILEGDKENIVSIIEDHILETISSIAWNEDTLDSDFSYLSERYNQFIQNLEISDIENISCLIALSYKDLLSLATIGDAEALLVEKDEVSQISSHEKEKHTFHYISHGQIPPGGNIYLSSTSLLGLFGESLVVEMSELSTEEWAETTLSLAKEEKYDGIHIFRLSEPIKVQLTQHGRKKQIDILTDSGAYIVKFIKKLTLSNALKAHFDNFFVSHRKGIQYAILISGIIILFLLAYSLISSLFSAISSSSSDSQNNLIRAQNLIIESQKLTSNKGAFNKNIKEAEEILFKLRDNKLHMADTQDLLARIEVMKKEVNDIQTVDLKKLTSLIKFNTQDISPLGVFEYNKKLNVIGAGGAILGYSRGEVLPKVIPYPTAEVAKSFAASDDGNVFILTANDRVITPRRNEFSYVTVTGEDGWEKAKSIDIFNNNLYLVSNDGKNIFRHRPGINGYSARTNMIENLDGKVLDIAIDGGVYIIQEEGKIQRFVSGKTEGAPKGLIINKIPGEYTIGQSDPLKVVSQSNLVYLYILSGDRIWIFSPDSKRFQDISSLSYVAQLELSTDEEIRDIFIPRDGSIYVTTNMGIYEVQFEIVDGKILLR